MKSKSQKILILTIIFIVVLVIGFLVYYFFLKKEKFSKDSLPSQIIFIRHGEKPEKGGDLNPTGYAHAACWADFFTNNRPSTINKPDLLYAMKDSQKGKHSSNRPVETITPLSKKLNKPINDNYLRDDLEGVISDILKNSGKTVLVCWEHDTIPLLVTEVIKEVYNGKDCNLNVQSWGYNPGARKNDGSDFSSIWVVNFNNNIFNMNIYPGCSVNDDNSCNFNLQGNNQPKPFSCETPF